MLLTSGNILFYMMMLSGPIVALSSSNWFMCWVGVELSFIGVLPLLMSDKMMTVSKESSLKYFCVQALGSGLLMCGGILKFNLPVDCSDYVFLAGIVLKLGAFPMHFWVPSVVSGLSLVPLFLVLTWQKVAPFLFLINLLDNCPWLKSVGLMIGGCSAVVGGLIGLNQTKIQPILGASSISHTGWAMVATVSGCFWIYFLLYCLSVLFLFFFLKSRDLFHSSLMMVGLSGLPPFILFLGKWSVLKMALSSGVALWVLILPVVGSLLSLFFYLKMFFSMYLKAEVSSSKLSKVGSVVFFMFVGSVFLVMC